MNTQMLSNRLKRLLTLTSAFLSRSVVYSFPTSGRLIARNYTPTSLKMADLTSNEVKAAAIAKSSDPAINPALPTFFDKLVSKEVPSKIIYEDDLCMAFHDINPQGPVHFLVIPKIKDGLNRLSNAREDQTMLLGHLLYTAQKVANAEGLKEGGFRVVINDGSNGAQSVYHLHLHVIGGRQMGWPPG